jgi:hypothetical protein
MYARGQTWAGDDGLPNVTFMEYMQSQGLGHVAYGYKLAASPTNVDTVSWTNVDEIVLRYSFPGIPTLQNIVVDGVRHDYTAVLVTQLDAGTFAVRLDRPLGNVPGGGIAGDRVTFKILGAGPGGGDFVQQINVLQGDASREANGRVTANDAGYVKSRMNRSTNAPTSPTQSSYSVFADVDASGRVSSNDQGAVKSRLNDNMPALAAAAGELPPASTTDDLFASTPILA